ncbi:hypothetical protein BH20ACI2_BH20ACI2_05630 [soil metagenome]
MCNLAGVTFAGLALFLIMAAVWASESWGRYWGWDAKDVGALVAWLTYAGFVHSRIAYGWRGRCSAYFCRSGLSICNIYISRCQLLAAGTTFVPVIPI